MHRGAAMEKQWNSHREASEEAKPTLLWFLVYKLQESNLIGQSDTQNYHHGIQRTIKY